VKRLPTRKYARLVASYNRHIARACSLDSEISAILESLLSQDDYIAMDEGARDNGTSFGGFHDDLREVLSLYGNKAEVVDGGSGGEA